MVYPLLAPTTAILGFALRKHSRYSPGGGFYGIGEGQSTGRESRGSGTLNSATCKLSGDSLGENVGFVDVYAEHRQLGTSVGAAPARTFEFCTDEMSVPRGWPLSRFSSVDVWAPTSPGIVPVP
jgi:hypothetical protein